jgi:hypothetical protein
MLFIVLASAFLNIQDGHATLIQDIRSCVDELDGNVFSNIVSDSEAEVLGRSSVETYCRIEARVRQTAPLIDRYVTRLEAGQISLLEWNEFGQTDMPQYFRDMNRWQDLLDQLNARIFDMGLWNYFKVSSLSAKIDDLILEIERLKNGLSDLHFIMIQRDLRQAYEYYNREAGRARRRASELF